MPNLKVKGIELGLCGLNGAQTEAAPTFLLPHLPMRGLPWISWLRNLQFVTPKNHQLSSKFQLSG
jgi:hypothetical protein